MWAGRARAYVDRAGERDDLHRPGVRRLQLRRRPDGEGENHLSPRAARRSRSTTNRSPACKTTPRPISGPSTCARARRGCSPGKANPPGTRRGPTRIQAYNFRMIADARPANQRLPRPEPATTIPGATNCWLGYLARQARHQGRHARRSPCETYPNGKTDTNNNGAFSTDYIGGQLGLSGSHLRAPRGDLAGPHRLPKGLLLFPGATTARSRSVAGGGERVGPAPRMNSRTPTTGRISSMCARRAAWSANTS